MTVAYVILGDDYYEHEYFRDASGITLSSYDKDRVFEIPMAQLVRWEDNEAAYRNMQDEIADLLRRRREDKNFARPSTWNKHLPSPGLPF